MRRAFSLSASSLDLSPAPAPTLGMVQVQSKPNVQLFTDAINKLMAMSQVAPVPAMDIKRQGDLDPQSYTGLLWYDAVCPPGYKAFRQDCQSCSDASALCRKTSTPSTNSLPYSPAGGVVGEGFWREAVANAAASWYLHDNSNVNDAWTNPIVLQPWIDLANAWFWGTHPYALVGSQFVQSLGGGSAANQLPWNEVPWGSIPASAWAWLAEHDTTSGSPVVIDWADIALFIASLPDAQRIATLTANAGSPDVSWMDTVDPAVGFSEAPAAWKKNYRASQVASWALHSWKDVPWMEIPWASINWPLVKNGADLKAALKDASLPQSPCLADCSAQFAATGNSAQFDACAQACAANPGPGGLQYVNPFLVVKPDVNTVVPEGTIAVDDPITGNTLVTYPDGTTAQIDPATGQIVQLDPATGCSGGKTKVNGVCKAGEEKSGMSAGNVAVVGGVLLATWAIFRMTLKKPIIPGL
jgi:hypothetical protein